MTDTPSSTDTPVPGGEGFKISTVLIYPDPYSATAGGLIFRADIDGIASSVRVRMYSVSFRRVFEWNYKGVFIAKTDFNIPDGNLKALASGVYYLSLTAKSPEGNTAAAKTAPFVILR